MQGDSLATQGWGRRRSALSQDQQCLARLGSATRLWSSRQEVAAPELAALALLQVVVQALDEQGQRACRVRRRSLLQ